jgi:hypothetical protein
LRITKDTVRTHTTHIYAKIGVSNRTEAALYVSKNAFAVAIDKTIETQLLDLLQDVTHLRKEAERIERAISEIGQASHFVQVEPNLAHHTHLNGSGLDGTNRRA